MTCGIYRIYNKVNGKSYIGQSKNVEKRLRDHFRSLNSGNHYNHYLQSAFLLYGAENFEHQLVEACEEAELTEREQFWIDTALHYAGIYNHVLIAGPGRKGYKATLETRKKISEARKHKTHTEETRHKISEAAKGRTLSEETRQNISAGLKGKPKSEEHRRKMSEAAKTKVFSEEHRRKIGEASKRNMEETQ